MIDAQRAFRDYVTRVSFNLTMSRNQIGVLRSIVLDIESWQANAGKNWFDRGEGNKEARELRVYARTQMGVTLADNFIVGMRYLMGTGLIRETVAHAEQEARIAAMAKAGKQPPLRSTDIQHFEMTEAGEHVVALLRLAGLIPARAVNANVSRKRKRGAA